MEMNSIFRGAGSNLTLMFTENSMKPRILLIFKIRTGLVYIFPSSNRTVSFSKVSYWGNSTYTARSGFLNFGQYTVESRDRVKVIDGTYGVPISTQVRVNRSLLSESMTTKCPK